jgi:hypothetical protein
MNTCYELVTEMSKSDLQELESRLIVLIEHLLKIAHVTGQVGHDNARGWNQTVRNQRRDLAAHRRANPGLKSKLSEEWIGEAYRVALVNARAEHPALTALSFRRLSLDEIVGPDVVALLK